MTRCSKCNGCTNMWNTYRPTWCEDEDCSEGEKEPDEITKEREWFFERLRKVKEQKDKPND